MASITDGYFLIKGFVSKSELLANGTNVKNLPVQADQKYGRLWVRPGNEADLVHPSNIVDTISGRRFAYGGAVFKWPMVGLSPKMVGYLHETYFDFNWYAELTVQTFNRANGDWEAYWVTARWPDYTAEAELSAGGYNNFQIGFVNGILAPSGPNMTISGSATRNFQVGSFGTFNLTASNSGDFVNFDPVYINYPLPIEMVYSSYTGTNWNLFWSTDGITYTDISVTPPVTNSDVRYVRFKYDFEIDIGQSSQVTLTLRPDISGLSINDFTVSTNGDSGTTGKIIEFQVDISDAPFRSGFSLGFGPSDSGFNNGFDSPNFGISRTAFNPGFTNGFGTVET